MAFGARPEEGKGKIEGEGFKTSRLNLPLEMPKNPEAGNIYFDAKAKAIRVYDGKTWRSIKLD